MILIGYQTSRKTIFTRREILLRGRLRNVEVLKENIQKKNYVIQGVLRASTL